MKFRKKPVVIEALQFKTNNEVGSPHMDALVAWIGLDARHDGTSIFIQTLDGEMRADVRDWIIKGVKGEFYPCKPDIFEASYEEVKTTGSIRWLNRRCEKCDSPLERANQGKTCMYPCFEGSF